jgi:hypothetical protein
MLLRFVAHDCPQVELCVASKVFPFVSVHYGPMTSADSLSRAGHEDMLPGIRFIFVTVILSASVLIFGLGAAALLRVSHEEFATLPSWRVTQSQFPPAPVETVTPTLAMLRIEMPDPAKPDVVGESPASAQPHSDADLKARDVSDKLNATTQVSPQPETPPVSVEKSADMGGQPAPVPPDAPAPIAVAVAPAPTIEKTENGATGSADPGSKNSEAVTPEAPAVQTKTAETKPDVVETPDTKVASIMASEAKVSESKSPETEADIGVTAAITAVTNGHEIKLRMIKVHVTKTKTVAKKKSRSGIYAMVQRRRAAARARAIARERAARLAQLQRFVATDPLAALFGVQPQPTQVVQSNKPAQPRRDCRPVG